MTDLKISTNALPILSFNRMTILNQMYPHFNNWHITITRDQVFKADLLYEMIDRAMHDCDIEIVGDYNYYDLLQCLYQNYRDEFAALDIINTTITKEIIEEFLPLDFILHIIDFGEARENEIALARMDANFIRNIILRRNEQKEAKERTLTNYQWPIIKDDGEEKKENCSGQPNMYENEVYEYNPNNLNRVAYYSIYTNIVDNF